jgi:hypothetical protein
VLGPFPRVSVSSDFSRSCCDNKKTIQHQFFDFFLNYTSTDVYVQHMHTHFYEYTYANPTLMSTSKRLCRHISRLIKSPQVSRYRRERRLPLKSTLNPEIDEVTIGASLSTGTSSTTESTLNPGINLEKCEHSCQVENLNPCE